MAKTSAGTFKNTAGRMASFWLNLAKAVEDRGGSDEVLANAVKEGSPLIAKFADLIVGIANAFSLFVDYTKSVEALVAQGNYAWKNGDINSRNFKTSRTSTATLAVELVHFNRTISTDEALRELDRMGLRPLELHELLAFGIQFPDEQLKYPIVALASVWRSPSGRRYVPCLDGSGSGRDLNLGWFVYDWLEIYRFAAVRK